jgi:Glycosyl hydrolase family 63 C-terminal domain
VRSGVSIETAARELLEDNTQSGVKDGRTYTFSVPSPEAYPFQWFWDSCFHAIVWARFDAERAAEELRGLLAWQGRDGFIPHVIFWNRELARRNPNYWHFRESRPWLRRPKTTARLQPPVLAQAVERVVDAGGGDPFLRETIGPLERYYRYLAKARDPDGDLLLTIISSFESGLDHSPVYDYPFSLHVDDADPLQADPWWTLRREFVNKLFGHRASLLSRVRRSTHEDVHFTSIYAQGLRALARLAERAGDDGLARWSRETAARVTEALMERSYDARQGLFWNLVGAREHPVRVKTIVSLMPLILDDLPRTAVEALVEHLANPEEFWLDYPVASTARDEPAFVPTRTRLIWRGPTSMNTNWFLAHALRAHGYPDLADTIGERSRELVERHGFNEFYNPLNGEPVGVETFGWATLVVDL